jgi:hypothetical protein
MAHRTTDIGFDFAPEEGGISLCYIRWSDEAKLLIDADLGELVKERIELARIKRVTKLPDQVRGTDQAAPASLSVLVWSPSSGTGNRVVSSIARMMRSASITG